MSSWNADERLFVGGPLIDSVVLSALVGPKANDLHWSAATILSDRAQGVAGADGYLISGLHRADIRRLFFYAGADYLLRPVRVVDDDGDGFVGPLGVDGRRRRITAWAFLPSVPLKDSDESRGLGLWKRSATVLTVRIAPEVTAPYKAVVLSEEPVGPAWMAGKSRAHSLLLSEGTVSSAAGSVHPL